jgi:hypothetical protein
VKFIVLDYSFVGCFSCISVIPPAKLLKITQLSKPETLKSQQIGISVTMEPHYAFKPAKINV